MQRLRYFDGQLLTAKDFQAEQEYQIEKRRLHNRLLHGFGVVDGLAVSVARGPGTIVHVSPGFALDDAGNEIFVEDLVCLDLGICTSNVCFVTIGFAETATDPVPVGTDGGVEFSRVTEGYSVRIESEDPSENANSPQLALARLIRVEDLWALDETYCRQTL